jgi:hypothetical protein
MSKREFFTKTLGWVDRFASIRIGDDPVTRNPDLPTPRRPPLLPRRCASKEP